MTVSLTHGAIRLSGACSVDDAEPLLRLVQEHPGSCVDMSECEHLHAAVVQVLQAFSPRLSGVSGDAFTREFVVPVLSGTRG